VPLTIRAAAFETRCNLSATDFGAAARALLQDARTTKACYVSRQRERSLSECMNTVAVKIYDETRLSVNRRRTDQPQTRHTDTLCHCSCTVSADQQLEVCTRLSAAPSVAAGGGSVITCMIERDFASLHLQRYRYCARSVIKGGGWMRFRAFFAVQLAFRSKSITNRQTDRRNRTHYHAGGNNR